MLKKILNSFNYSKDGLRWAFFNELSFRIDVFLFSPLFFIAIFLGRSYVECVVLIIPIFLILICELINTAIEAICDHVSLEFDGLIKVCKDVASAAVFLSIAMCLFVWASFLFSRFS